MAQKERSNEKKHYLTALFQPAHQEETGEQESTPIPCLHSDMLPSHPLHRSWEEMTGTVQGRNNLQKALDYI